GISYERLAYSYLAAGEKSVSSAQAFDLLRLAGIAVKEERTRGYFREARPPFADYRTTLHSTSFLRSFDLFLEKYGHRGHHESDLALPRYREDPSPLLFAIQQHVDSPMAPPSPAEIVEGQNSEAVKAWNELESKLNWWQRPTLAPVAMWLLRRIKQFY